MNISFSSINVLLYAWCVVFLLPGIQQLVQVAVLRSGH